MNQPLKMSHVSLAIPRDILVSAGYTEQITLVARDMMMIMMDVYATKALGVGMLNHRNIPVKSYINIIWSQQWCYDCAREIDIMALLTVMFRRYILQ